MKMTSNRSYLIRAFHEWIVDNGMTPYVLVNATMADVQVPEEFVKDGRIILNISPQACHGLVIDFSHIVFSARFSGIAKQVSFHPRAVLAIYAKETGRGMMFEHEEESDDEGDRELRPSASTSNTNTEKKSHLKVVK